METRKGTDTLITSRRSVRPDSANLSEKLVQKVAGNRHTGAGEKRTHAHNCPLLLGTRALSGDAAPPSPRTPNLPWPQARCRFFPRSVAYGPRQPPSAELG
ncbi:hypothetical protein Anapl_08085 [Anas platyrhynchos]|uniref:Uncharacterized protein n=1 Tax=Anas platyrhynchos TaxID=8839 RepID=R0LR58_ANAPL|nr:hypothetical protein Anapl_08085 [Anas platyrhynchos]